MAVLTSSDYGELRRLVYRAGDGKEELKALPTLPNETQLLAIFQAIEDRLVAAALLARGDIETILGRQLGADATSRAAALRKLMRAWMRWRDAHGG
jgi:hypothetical protein